MDSSKSEEESVCEPTVVVISDRVQWTMERILPRSGGIEDQGKGLSGSFEKVRRLEMVSAKTRLIAGASSPRQTALDYTIKPQNS